MERRGHPKPKITHSLGFKVQFDNRGYECKEASGSLKPGCRRLLYCPQCDAPECVWGGPTFKQVQAGAKVVVDLGKPVVSGARHELYSRASKRNARKKRALGLTPGGKPLGKSCFNCLHVRKDHTGLICQFHPLDRPVGETAMRQRCVEKTGCRSFEMRLTLEIEELGTT